MSFPMLIGREVCPGGNVQARRAECQTPQVFRWAPMRTYMSAEFSDPPLARAPDRRRAARETLKFRAGTLVFRL